MSACSCLKRDDIGPSAPREYATWLVDEWAKECPVHKDCLHRPGGGMCANCQPAMFPNLPSVPPAPAVTVSDEEVRYWQGKATSYPGRDPNIIRENILRGKRLGTYDPNGAYIDLGAPRQRAGSDSQSARASETATTAPAASPPESDRAPWQELTPQQLVMLDTFASLAEDGRDEVHVDELTALFVESAAGIGLTSWTEAEVRAALADLQKLGYAGVTAIGGETWAIGNRGRYVIEDYRRNRVLGVA